MGAKYFIFDMDETLAELYPMYYFVASLRLKELLEEDKTDTIHYPPETLLSSLNKAYNKFVDGVLQEEVSNEPLGILRPGVLDVMKRLYDLQKRGLVKHVLIYSNNGHLQSLEFIRDLIHRHIGTDNLIKECIHWNHRMRDDERFMRPGASNKTWKVIKNIMVNGICNAPNDLGPDSIYFFDDLDHKDLQVALGKNYYKVPGYDFKASFDRIAAIYRTAIISSKVDVHILMKYIIDLFVNEEDFLKINDDETIDTIIEIFRTKTRGTANGMPPKPDGGIEMMMDAIRRVEGDRVGGKRKRVFRICTRKRRAIRRTKTARKN